MIDGRPDPERRLVPRWRASRGAANAGELRSAQPKTAVLPTTQEVPEFEALRAEWAREHTVEVAGDLISCGVTLGRAGEREVQEAARLLVSLDVPNHLRSVANRVLAGTLGVETDPPPIAFDTDQARAELQTQIATHKRRVRVYPKNALAWMDLARLYTALGQQEKAREAIRVATNLAPENRFVLRSTARFLVHADGRNREDQIQEGLWFLRGSQLLRRDPWIMAAEISLSTIVAKEPGSLKWARALASEDALDPWDSSELNGALATLAIQQGGIGKPRKLFNRSLRTPTENALAQAQWASDRHKVVSVSDSMFDAMKRPAFEALALKHRAEHQWQQVIDDCRAWSAMEPTSTRPLFLGGFVAEVALENGEVAREFSERALLIEPNSALAHNNLAVALAYLGRVDEAEEHVARGGAHALGERMDTTSIATQGLLAYRRGQREKGIELYLRAAKTQEAETDPGLRAMVVWHLLREEARLRVAGIDELAELLWKQTVSQTVPELEALYHRIRQPDLSVEERVAAILRPAPVAESSPPLAREDIEGWWGRR